MRILISPPRHPRAGQCKRRIIVPGKHVIPVFIIYVTNLLLKIGDFITARAGEQKKAVTGLVPAVQLFKIIATLQ